MAVVLRHRPAVVQLSMARLLTTAAAIPSRTNQSIGHVASLKASVDPGCTMPPGCTARVGRLKTFELPERVTGSAADWSMGRALVDAWRTDGILQVAQTREQRNSVYKEAMAASKRFFGLTHATKSRCVDQNSYSGYIASGEEITDGIADYSEIFTVTKDLTLHDPRVRAQWPCHGPCPWPDTRMKDAIRRYMDSLGEIGEKILQLVELGLHISQGSLTDITRDGWHHMRILR